MTLAQSYGDSAESLSISEYPFNEILTPAALEMVASLAREYSARIRELLDERAEQQRAWSAGEPLGFRADTVAIREGKWRVGDIPADLRRRIVEITGPVDRKMIINALNSGADVFMADFEDATAPTWHNLIHGQVNIRDAVRRTIAYSDDVSGKKYVLDDRIATLIVRPRGLHLPESHLTVSGVVVPGCLFDAALFLFHNAHALIERGSGPYLYLPKLQSAEEAELWNDV